MAECGGKRGGKGEGEGKKRRSSKGEVGGEDVELGARGQIVRYYRYGAHRFALVDARDPPVGNWKGIGSLGTRHRACLHPLEPQPAALHSTVNVELVGTNNGACSGEYPLSFGNTAASSPWRGPIACATMYGGRSCVPVNLLRY